MVGHFIFYEPVKAHKPTNDCLMQQNVVCSKESITEMPVNDRMISVFLFNLYIPAAETGTYQMQEMHGA